MATIHRFPLGISNYRELVSDDYCFVDKSEAIKEVIEDGAKVIIITRPRRFGKTLFMSMLHYFFASDVDGASKPLFQNTHIQNNHPALFNEHQGNYEVISLSLKDIKSTSFKEALDEIKEEISNLYQEHRNVLNTKKLSDEQRNEYLKIINKNINIGELKRALFKLSKYLKQAYNKRVIILIDEYDTPIINAYLNGFYDELIKFMRSFLSTGLKDNKYCYKIIVTGILRVAKESLFSDLNNSKIYTVLEKKYANAFGFTLKEVQQLFKNIENKASIDDVQKWYNGYLIGTYQIFNPWSIIQCLHDSGTLSPYWVNTSDNSLLVDIIAKAQSTFKTQFQLLLKEKTQFVKVSSHMHLKDIENNDTALWSLLLFSGYLTGILKEHKGLSTIIEAKIPNHEIYLLYKDMIISWFTEHLSDSVYDQLISDLTTGNIARFTQILQKFLLSSMSYFDATGSQPERFYHGFVLGLTATLQKHYTILSNRESGLGRYDLALIPHSNTRLGIIFEFKTENNRLNLEKTAAKALQQIDDNQYITTLKQAHLTKILKVGMAFCNKQVAVCSKLVQQHREETGPPAGILTA